MPKDASSIAEERSIFPSGISPPTSHETVELIIYFVDSQCYLREGEKLALLGKNETKKIVVNQCVVTLQQEQGDETVELNHFKVDYFNPIFRNKPDFKLVNDKKLQAERPNLKYQV